MMARLWHAWLKVADVAIKMAWWDEEMMAMCEGDPVW